MSKLSKRIITSLIGLAVAIFALWYFFSPQLTLSGMKSAYDSRDYEAFSEYIDFELLREDLKSEIAVEASQNAQDSDNPFDGLAGLAAPAIGNQFVDSMINPTAIRVAFQKAGKDAPDLKLVNISDGNAKIIRDGLRQFHIERDNGEKLIFRSYGLGWKLVGIDLPLATSSDENTDPKQSGGLELGSELVRESDNPVSFQINENTLVGDWVAEGDYCASESPLRLRKNRRIPAYGGSLDEPIDARWSYDGMLVIDDGSTKNSYKLTMSDENHLTIEWDDENIYDYTRC